MQVVHATAVVDPQLLIEERLDEAGSGFFFIHLFLLVISIYLNIAFMHAEYVLTVWPVINCEFQHLGFLDRPLSFP